MSDITREQKPILITGGCGYIGSRLALLLDKKGYKVIVADKTTPQERGIDFPDSIELRKGDLREKSVAKEAARGVGTVVHLAANIGALTYMHKYQAEILQENCAIDASFYPMAVKAGVERIIYSSSSMVFQHASQFPYQEEDLPNIKPPTNIYGMSKLMGEYFCRAFYEQFGLFYVILRYHNIYGPGESSKGEEPGDIHVIPALIEKVLNNQYPIEILGDPEATRTFTYVDDAVKATFMITERALKNDKEVLNNDFNIGPDKALKITELAKTIWELLGDERPFKYKMVRTKAVTAKRREMSSQKIKEIIGWEPETKLKEGILKTAQWIKARKGDDKFKKIIF